MRVLIVEDEYHAQRYLTDLIMEVRPSWKLLTCLDTVQEAVSYLESKPSPDLLFFDVQLADGLSFDIFDQVELSAPVIFTTAFDEYTLRAFKVNSVDYLLKPVDRRELQKAIDKFERLHRSNNLAEQTSLLHVMKGLMQQKQYRQRFLIKQGKDYVFLTSASVAFIYSEDGLTFIVDTKGKRHLLDHSLEQLAKQLDPEQFFRISRKMVVAIGAVQKINNYFNHRLKLDLNPISPVDAIVSRDRARDFKAWLDR